MKNIADEIIDEVRRYVSGVPDAVIKDSINKGTRRYLLESQVWQDEQELSAYSKQVLVHSDFANTFISDVKTVKTLNGRLIAANYRNGALQFYSAPNQEVIATLVIVTNDDTPMVPEWIVYQHREAIIHASVAKLTSQSVQPWFEPNSAAYHEGEYLRYLGYARIADTPEFVQSRPFV